MPGKSLFGKMVGRSKVTRRDFIGGSTAAGAMACIPVLECSFLDRLWLHTDDAEIHAGGSYTAAAIFCLVKVRR